MIAKTLMVSFLVVAVSADKDLQTVAEKCCAAEHRDCCIDSMQFFKPLSCVPNHDEKLEMVKCMQEELFGEPTLVSLVVQDFGCCSVFDTNDNDPESNCLYHCENTVMIPSLHPREKIRRIRKCMMTNFKNTVYKCFVKCQASRRVRSHERFQLERHCNMTDFMRANQFYYGAAVLSP